VNSRLPSNVEEELVTLAMEQVEAQRCRRENRGISPRNMGISWDFMGFHGDFMGLMRFDRI